MSNPPLSLESHVVINPGRLSADVAEEKVIFDATEGMYYGLSGVGGRVWELLSETRTVAEILDTLLVEYEVDRPRCETDLLNLLGTLLEKGLIQVTKAG